MQSEEVVNRLDSPPVIDGRDKPIDLGDMPKDMNKELAKAAIYDIVEEICEKYKEGDLRSKTFRHNLGIAIFNKIKNEGFVYSVIDKEATTADEYNMKWLKEHSSTKKYFAEHGLYYIDDIRESVDLAIGDDGFRSKEVVAILKTEIGE